ncbi:MAG: hypothetical protein ACK4YP_09970 [Myxococcota bacterium]
MLRWLFPLQCLALALALTWPAPAVFWSEAVGSVEGDGVKHLWTLWWMRAEALGGAPGLRTTLINYPVGLDLYPIEPLNGLLALILPFDPVPLSNLLAIVHLFLLGLCAGWLGKLVSERPLGAFAAGALAQGSAFAAFTLHAGVGELRQVWWIPLGLGCLVKARTTLEPRWFTALALTLAGATLSCFYHGFFLAVAVAVYALATLRPWPRLLAGYVVAAALSLAIVLPVVQTFSASYAPMERRGAESFGEWMAMRYDLPVYQGAALDPVELLTPRHADPATIDRQTLNYTGGRYLGWSVLLLAAIGAVAAPRKALPWVVVGAGGLVLAFGTVLWWDGAMVGVSGGRVVLPLATINRALAWVAEPMNFPARFVVVPTIALAVLGALAMRWPWALVLVPVAVAEVLWGDLVPFPRATITLPKVDRAAIVGAGLPAGAVADLTAFTRAPSPGGGLLSRLDPESRTRAIAAQLVLDRPFSTVPIERIDHWGPEGLAWTAALPIAGGLDGRVVDDEGLRASAFLLADAGFGAVVVSHGCENGPPAAAAVLDRALGARVAAVCATVWPVPPVTEAPADAERWKAEHAARLGR